MNSASQSMPLPLDTADAEAQLATISAKRDAGAKLAGAIWFPLLIAGIANIAEPSVIDLIGGAAAPAIYWSIAGPVIGLSCAAFYAVRPVQMPQRVGWISVALAATMTVAALVLGMSLGDSSGGAPLLAVTMGLGAFAWLYRSIHVGVVALANLAGAVAMFAGDSERTADLTFLLVGAVSCAVAIVALLVDRTNGLNR